MSLTQKVSDGVAALRERFSDTPTARLTALEKLGQDPNDQDALRHAALNDPHPAVRIIAAQKIELVDIEPLLAMSDDADVRLIFAKKSRLKDMLVAMDLCDPDAEVKTVAAQSLTRDKGLVCIEDDPRAAAYYLKFAP